MRVSVVLEQRFDKTADGHILAPSGIFAYKFWQRYLEVFDSVNVVARVQENVLDASCPRESSHDRADGDRVSFSCIPHFIGPRQYVLKARKIRRALRQSIGRDDAVILRTPGTLSSCLQPYLQQAGHPYAVEVVGDPYDVFAPGAAKHPLRPVFRRLFSRRLQQQCDNAHACSYVTEKKLQLRYLPGKGSFSTHYSSIELPPEAIVKTARQFDPNKKRLSIIHVGTFSQLYKAPDVLIDAVAQCVQKGMDLQLTMIGDGKFRSFLESRPTARELGNRLRFLGRLAAGKAIRDELDKADLFVLPSRTEGLPRAMIEAMARGLPCIGSTVGGFPELVPDEDMVPPGDTAALTQKIQDVLTDKGRLHQMSCRNLAKAACYRDDLLNVRRIEFFEQIEKITAAYKSSLCSNQKDFTMREELAGTQHFDNTKAHDGEFSPVKKIVIVCNHDLGAYRFRKGLFKAIIARDIKLTVVTPSGTNVHKIEELGAKHIAVPMYRFISPFRDVLLFWRLFRLFRSEKPDIVHNITIKPNVFGSLAARLAGVKTIFLHAAGVGCCFSDEPGWKQHAMRQVASILYRIATRNATRMLFVNQDDLKLFVNANLICPKKTALISGEGIDVDEYSEKNIDAQEIFALRSELGLGQSTQVVVMMLARVTWSKGTRQFVNASRIAGEWEQPIKFLLAGPLDPDASDAVPESYLRENESSTFSWLGYRTDVRNIVALSDIVTLPSYYREGFPTTLLEALAMGKPIVTTDSVGCRDSVNNGENGFLVPIKNSEAFADAVKKLVENDTLLESFGRRSRERAENEFSSTFVAEEILKKLYGLDPSAKSDTINGDDKKVA